MSLHLVLLALISSAFGLIYEKLADLPTTDFDFIIVGGMHLEFMSLSVVL